MDNLHFDIRKVREDMGMTQEEFSEFCGLSRSSIARYELGTNPPNRAALKKIATALNTTVSVLLGEESADQEQQKKKPAAESELHAAAHSLLDQMPEQAIRDIIQFMEFKKSQNK